MSVNFYTNIANYENLYKKEISPHVEFQLFLDDHFGAVYNQESLNAHLKNLADSIFPKPDSNICTKQKQLSELSNALKSISDPELIEKFKEIENSISNNCQAKESLEGPFLYSIDQETGILKITVSTDAKYYCFFPDKKNEALAIVQKYLQLFHPDKLEGFIIGSDRVFATLKA